MNYSIGESELKGRGQLMADNLAQKLAEGLMQKHGEACDCMLGHFLRETGFKTKDVRMMQQQDGNGGWSFIFVHKNTPKKYFLLK